MSDTEALGSKKHFTVTKPVTDNKRISSNEGDNILCLFYRCMMEKLETINDIFLNMSYTFNDSKTYAHDCAVH